MRLPRLLLAPWLLHLLAWLGFAVYEQSVLLFSHTAKFDFAPTLLNYLLNAALFYTNSSLLLPHCYARRRWAAYLLAALAALTAYALLRTELYLDLVPALELLKLPAADSYRHFWILSLYRGSFFLFVSLGYWFARNALALETQKREQAQQLRATERSLMRLTWLF